MTHYLTSFAPRNYNGMEYLKCRFCGVELRSTPSGMVRYNHDLLDYCPYCVAYAAQPGLPHWVLDYKAKTSARPQEVTHA